MPYGLFLHGNSSVNIRNADALYSEKGKQITKAIFGEGPKDKDLLGEGVYKSYGKGTEGFNIGSIQFALHYMFESQIQLQNFLRNISECTKVGGYFISTCYDGKTLFKKLKKKKQGEELSILKNGKKIWSITKQYNRSDFPNDTSCLGYAIDVYQESINKTFREYLVNFDYLVRLMEDYGFVLLTRDEYKEIGLPSSSGMFKELFGIMNNEIMRKKSEKNDYGEASKMSTEEKDISFLNRFCVFKKIRSVDAEKISRILMNKTKDEEKEDHKENKKIEKIITAELKQDKPKVAKKQGKN